MVNVIGLGYNDLPTALMMSSYEIEVRGTNYSQRNLDKLNSDRTAFKEEKYDVFFKLL